ncbi:MAG: hypothetical protein WAN94_11330 [Pseudolabrys sp.]
MLYSITGNALLCRAMPRYYFHLRGSGARDTEGQEFPNEEVAREEARAWRATYRETRL